MNILTREQTCDWDFFLLRSCYKKCGYVNINIRFENMHVNKERKKNDKLKDTNWKKVMESTWLTFRHSNQTPTTLVSLANLIPNTKANHYRHTHPCTILEVDI